MRTVASILATLLPVVFVGAGASAKPAIAPQDLALGNPAAIVDLSTPEGLRLVSGQWKYADARIVRAEGRAPGADLKPSGRPVKTLDIVPRAGAAGFDDSSWPVIGDLEQRRGKGKLSFGWYRLRFTVPERVGTIPIRGATLVFEIVVDDYAEIWVDGKLPTVLGQTGAALVKGFNAPNRVALRDVAPGQQVQIAVFAINGPISASPNNFLWVRTATLEVHEPIVDQHSYGTVSRTDPAIDEIVPAGARIEKVADGFQFLEGPVWHPDGYLLFSDPNANTIYRWAPEGQVSVYRAKSGYKGVDVGEYHQPGSNGLTLDREGRLTINEHGNRRVTRLERTGALTVLAERYEGKRLNSPNDLVYRSDGALYFTDPPFGLPRAFDDPRKELPNSGVFCLNEGKLRLVSTDLTGPNGLAFSPDERFLYVDDWDLQRKIVMRYQVAADCTLSNGEVFFDMTSAPGEEALDGMKVDQRGNLYVSGPGGVWVISPTGKHLGTIQVEQLPANMAWGDADGRALYFTARSALYRIRLDVAGIRPPLVAGR